MKVWFIGAGPGDPELMTRKAWRLLGQADVVLHDALMDILGMKEAAPHAQWLEVGKRSGRPSVEQAFICRTLVALAKRGLTVVRLKGGDPAIFGRLAEELEACRAEKLDVEIVPGVTAACAAAADLQTSLTLRGESRSVVFVTPRVGKYETGAQGEWLAAAMAAQTVVLYMASSQAKDLCAKLLAAGKAKDTPLCIVENASRTGRRLKHTLLEIAQRGLPALEGPVTLLLGQALRHAKAQDSGLEKPIIGQQADWSYGVA
jgi:uroporphyrin-III C-methyltransferase